MLMNIVIKDKLQLIFFLAGFVLLSFAGLSAEIAIVFIFALAIMFLSNGQSAPAAAGAEAAGSASAVYEDDDLF